MATNYRTGFYRTARGSVPVAEFMQKLNETGRAKGASKIIEYARLLREQGLALGFPYVSHVSGDLWELRPTQGNNAYRVLFYEAGAGSFVLLHALIERDGLNEADKATAERRMQEHRKRYGRG